MMMATGNGRYSFNLLLRAAEDLRRAINIVLSGPGAVVASEIALDYISVNDALGIQEIYAQCGVVDREELLEMLNADLASPTVTEAMVRMEVGIVQFAMAMIGLHKVKPDKQTAYCCAMCQLVDSIDRSVLVGGTSCGAGEAGNVGVVIESSCEEVSNGVGQQQLAGGAEPKIPEGIPSVTGRNLPVQYSDDRPTDRS